MSIPSTIESTTRTIASSGMSSEMSGGRSIIWCCLQGLNLGSPTAPSSDLGIYAQIIPYQQVRCGFLRDFPCGSQASSARQRGFSKRTRRIASCGRAPARAWSFERRAGGILDSDEKGAAPFDTAPRCLVILRRSRSRRHRGGGTGERRPRWRCQLEAGPKRWRTRCRPWR